MSGSSEEEVVMKIHLTPETSELTGRVARTLEGSLPDALKFVVEHALFVKSKGLSRVDGYNLLFNDLFPAFDVRQEAASGALGHSAFPPRVAGFLGAHEDILATALVIELADGSRIAKLDPAARIADLAETGGAS